MPAEKLEAALRYVAEHAWSDFGHNVCVNDVSIAKWVPLVLAGEAPEEAGVDA